LIIKTASDSLSNKEEQLFTTPLEKKDHQGGTQLCISGEHQFVNQESTKIKKGLTKKSMQLSASSSPGLDGIKKSLMQRRGPAQWT
jgi:hypothetical protein